MCCVGGMVEDTTLEAIGHRFKSYGVHIYSDAFFSKWLFSTGPAVAAGTKSPGRPVQMSFFLAMNKII